MGVDDLREALAKSKRARLIAIVQESLPRDALKDICVAVGLDNSGKEKSVLVDRILAAGGGSADGESAAYKIDPPTAKADHAREGAAPFGALLPGLGGVSAKPAKAKSEGKGKGKDGQKELQHVQAGLGGGVVRIGQAGGCRYCSGSEHSEPRRFRKVAHTFPEALGNKWVRSLDACDDGNSTFSVYESALASSVGAFLTLGGVKAKGNKVRKTGRTEGPAQVRHSEEDGQRRISTMLRDQDMQIGCDLRTGNLGLTFPIATESFRPRHAYKALSKMGFSLLPADALANYAQLRA